jgi:hypothetical protein
MANEQKQAEQKQEIQQPFPPAAQVELTDEELKRVTGGGVIIHDSPVTAYPPGPGAVGPEI